MMHTPDKARHLVQTSTTTATQRLQGSLKAMRRIAPLLAVVLGGLLTATTIAVAHPVHKPPFKCPSKNEGVMVADAQAVVYKATNAVYEPEEHKFVEGLQEIFGCARGAKRSYHLGLPPYGGKGGSGGVYSITLAGPVVAYDATDNSPIPPNGSSSNEIWVRSLRTGKLIHRTPNDSPSSSGAEGKGETMSIVAKTDGAVAWTTHWIETGPLAPKICRASPSTPACVSEEGPMHEWEKVYTAVHVADKLGTRIVATGANIEPRSLALAGSTLYWTQGGKPMSATLN